MQSPSVKFAPTPPGGVAGLFAAVYAPLVWLGFELHEPDSLAILWPGAGLLFVTLWFTPPRRWPRILLVQLVVEILIGLLVFDDFQLQWSLLFAAANAVAAMVGAAVARTLIADATQTRILTITEFLGATAVGSAAGAIVGAYGAEFTPSDASFADQWQLWWAGHSLGTLIVAPAMVFWGVRWRVPAATIEVRRSAELVLLAVLVVSATAWVYTELPTATTSMLRSPFALLALFVFVAFRLPPRWVVVLAASAVILAAWFEVHRLGPFAQEASAFERSASFQVASATLIVFTLLLCVALMERQYATAQLAVSEQRYRNFVARSSEAVWRVELREPMPADLEIARQLDWLRTHAWLAEYNSAYQRMCRIDSPVDPAPSAWHADAAWSTILAAHFEAAAHKGYVLEGLRYSVPQGDETREYWAAINGVTEQGRLVRLWGIAQDISALTRVADRLRQERARLREYALELNQAEERARRATAQDLHDGIGQLLFAVGLNLGRLRMNQAADPPAALLDAERQLRDIQRMVGGVIADLSPPGLYDLGLTAALQWLAQRHASHNRLRLTLDLEQPEPDLDLDTRALVFRIVRELLRNVVKHAGVAAATVQMRSSAGEFRFSVADTGVGNSGVPAEKEFGGFGLYSIRERVRAVGGRMAVHTAPECGFRVEVTMPLGRPAVART